MRRTHSLMVLPVAALLALAACSTQKHDANIKQAPVIPATSQNASGTSSSSGDAVTAATPDSGSGGVTATLAPVTPGMPSFCSYEAPTSGSTKGCFACTPRSIPIYGCAQVDSGFDPKVDCTSDAHQMQCKTRDPATFTFNFDIKTIAENVYEQLPLLGGLLQGLLGANANNPLGQAASSLLGILVQNRDTLFKPSDITPMITELEAGVLKFVPILGKIDLTSFNTLINKQVGDFRKLVESKDFSINMSFDAIKGIMALIPTAGGGNLASLFNGFNIGALISSLSPPAATTTATK